MKRFFDNLYIDLIAAGFTIGMMATGYMLRFPLPPGSNKSLVLWGLNRHQWLELAFVDVWSGRNRQTRRCRPRRQSCEIDSLGTGRSDYGRHYKPEPTPSQRSYGRS